MEAAHDKLMLDSYWCVSLLPEDRVSALSEASGDLQDMRPVEAIAHLLEPDRDEAIEDWLWGRKGTCFDYRKIRPVPRSEKVEVMRMLKAKRVRGVVVGQSPDASGGWTFPRVLTPASWASRSLSRRTRGAF